MGRYVKQLEIPLVHDGEPYSVIIKPALYDDVISIDQDGDLIKQFRERLDKYIVELRMTDAAGVQVSKEDFLTVAYFAEAVMDAGTEWLKRAKPQNPRLPAA